MASLAGLFRSLQSRLLDCRGGLVGLIERAERHGAHEHPPLRGSPSHIGLNQDELISVKAFCNKQFWGCVFGYSFEH